MTRQQWFLPLAIVAAGAILAVSIYAVRATTDIAIPQGDPDMVRPVSPEDHLIGNPEAPVTVITYSDIDCEYCKDFQQTMAQIMTEYGPTGNVAWVYRHLPLIDVHAYSKTHADAAECVAAIGGEDKFWRFIDLLNAHAPNYDEFEPAGYPDVVQQLGVPLGEFNQCLTEQRYSARIEKDFGNALDTGADSAPYVVLLIKGQDTITIEGAVPYEAMKKLLDDSIARAAK